MAKKSKNGPIPPLTPICNDWAHRNVQKSNKVLYVCHNQGGSISIKFGGCIKGERNVAWLRRGWLSFKEDLLGVVGFIYLIGEINEMLGEDITEWPCWEDAKKYRTKSDGGVKYQGHLHFSNDRDALCFLSMFYKLESCPENPPHIAAIINNPCG